MHPDDRLRTAVKSFYAYLGSLILAGVGPIAASRLAERAELWARIAGVVVGVGAWIPLMLVIAWIIRVGDEFIRRIHLAALSVSFAGSLVLVSLFDWLAHAEFIDRPPLIVVWVSMASLWVVALIVCKRRFERPQ